MNEFTFKNPMAPLWIMYPEIPQFSIGWRMGYGEQYLIDFNNWFKELSKLEKIEYAKLFPAPKIWINYYNFNYNNKSHDFEDLDDYWIETVQLWNKKGDMKYNLADMIEKFTNANNSGNNTNNSNNHNLDFIFFWKPQNNTNNTTNNNTTNNNTNNNNSNSSNTNTNSNSSNTNIDESFLSQWQKSYFTFDVYEYNCAEQYMMAEKARIFKDEDNLEKIMICDSPNEMKSLGREVQNFNSELWDKVKYSIVLNGNYHKFSQNNELRNYLISTGDKLLVEASSYDKIWGIGFESDEVEAKNPNLWKGQNLIGFALMEVRDELKGVYKYYNQINWEFINRKYNLKRY
ncbi:NADAR family protein [Methanobrevibacter filiformis]|uniref:Swarming motility protein YbiA n=1 Tax=Methanobrevibacter filiformis TaxID=55758 RepID=A0A166EW17_9EURY|nr:NADAR family protein [Methanobrevibacter filiformis]KZX17074.1 swarming motility protein YbiA [Methanobrevibacter filiformis]